MAIGRVAGDPDRVGRRVVRHGGHRAVQHLDQPVVGMQLLPKRRRRHAAREPVDQHELLADVETALQELRLDAGELAVALEERLEAARIELPHRLPERDRLVRRLALAPDGGLRLAGVASRELGVQVPGGIAQHLGDRRALARGERRRGHRPDLADEAFVGLPDCREWKRVRPPGRSLGVCESQRDLLPGGAGGHRADLRRWRRQRDRGGAGFGIHGNAPRLTPAGLRTRRAGSRAWAFIAHL